MKPTLIDVHVGNRIRIARLIAEKSQSELAHKLGITFQQLQKNEKGTNRVSAGRLYEISEYLQVPISFFFEEIADDKAAFAKPKVDFSRPEIIEFAKVTQDIDPSVVRHTLNLLHSVPSNGHASK